MAGMHFDFTIGTESFIKGLRNIEDQMNKTAGIIQSLGRDYNVDGLENQILSLTKVIRDNEENISRNKEQLAQWHEQAQEALSNQDFDGFKAIQADIADGLKSLEQLLAETQQYKEALASLEESGEVEKAPMVFATEGEYEKANQLREEIQSLKDEIANHDVADEELADLRASLVEAEDELRAMEGAAADVAEALGSDLGGRAAHVSETFYELSAAVREQEKVVSELREKANNAKEALDALDDSASSEEVEDAQIKYSKLADELQNAENRLRNLHTAQEDAKEAYVKLNEELVSLNDNEEKHDSIMVKLLGGSEKYNEIISKLPEGLQNSIKGLEGMTGAAKAFIATPLGAILAALILAWEALTQWFERSEEGQRALAKVSGYLSGALEILKDIAASVGEMLYKAFTSPQKAGKAFVDFLKNQIAVRLQAVGKMGAAIGNILKEAFSGHPIDALKHNMQDLINGFAQLTSGIKDPIKRQGEFIDNAKNKITSYKDKLKESADLEVLKNEVKREEHQTKRLLAEYDSRAKELTARGKKRTKEETAELNSLKGKMEKAEMDLINKKIQIQERAMANGKYDSREDKNDLDDLYAERARIEGKYNAQKARLENEAENASSQAARKAEAAAKKAADERQKQLAAQEKFDKLLNKQKREEARRIVDTEYAARDAEIKAMEDGTQKTLAQIQLDFEKQQTAIERSYEDLKAKKIEAARQLWEANPSNKGEAFNPMAVDTSLTEEEQKAYNAQIEANVKTYADAVKENQRVDRQAMLDYLSEYGTTQEKKLAIAEEYAQKIAEVEKSTDSDEAKRYSTQLLQREQERKQSAAESKELLERIDFASLFQGTALLQGVADNTLKDILEYIQTDDFKKMDASDQKAIYDAITSLREQTNEGKSVFESGKDFSVASKELELFAQELADAKDVQEQFKKKMEEAADEAAHSTGYEREDALERMDAYRKLYEAQSDAVNNLSAKTQDAAARMASAAQAFQSKLNSVTSGISKLASGNGLSDMYSGLSDVIKGFGGNGGKDLTDATGALGKAGGYIGAAFSIADMINEQGLDKMVTNIASTASNAVTNIMKSMFSSDMWKSLLGGVVDGIMAPFDAIFGKQGNMEDLKKEVESLERSNEGLENALNGLSEKLDKASFGDISQIGRDMEEYTEKLEGNTRKMMYDAAGMWERGSHSVAAKYAGLTSAQDSVASIFGTESKSSLAQINKALGTSFASLEDMLNNITTSQMSDLTGRYVDVWQTFVDDINDLTNEHNGGELLVEKMTEFAGLDGRLDEVKEKIQTKMLGVSFDGMKDNFLSTIKDMTKDGSEIMDDFNDLVYRSIAGRYDEELKSLRKRAADAAEAEQWDVLHDLERQYKALVARAQADVEEAKRNGDIVDTESYRQSATGRSFSAMSQEKADELNGRFTAMQVGQEQILQQVIMGVAQMQTLTDAVVMRGVATSEIRNLVLSIDGNVDTITRQTKTMLSSFGDKLERIATTLETKL